MLGNQLRVVSLAVVASLLQAATATTGCKVVSPGDKNTIVLQGTVLTEGGAIPNSHILVYNGRIAHVGCGCTAGAQAEKATVVDCSGSVISPGYINLHEHIEYAATNPLANLGIKYRSRHNWRLGNQGFDRRDPDVNGTKMDATTLGELRHILSGTTSIVGGEMAPGLTRNLDFAAGLEDGLREPVDFWDVFPLDDAEGMLREGDCDYGPDAITQEQFAPHNRYLAHIGEGVSAQAHNEFSCLSNMTFDTVPMAGGGGLSTDIITPSLAIVHGVALTEADFDMVAQRGAHVVWSPRSNLFLYGKTLNVSYLLDAGINVALGTDWLPSGSATMNREAVCAAYVSEKGFGAHLEAKTLWTMMTINAAKASSFDKQIGSLEVGKLADIAVFSGNHTDPYANAIYASGENVELVMRGGKIMVMSADASYLAKVGCETASFGDATKIVCVSEHLNGTFAEFQASLSGVYPAILPGIPPDEPLCELTY